MNFSPTLFQWNGITSLTFCAASLCNVTQNFAQIWKLHLPVSPFVVTFAALGPAILLVHTIWIAMIALLRKPSSTPSNDCFLHGRNTRSLRILVHSALFQTVAYYLCLIIATGATAGDDVIDANLSNTWKDLYNAHDAASIKSIQDQLQCCGFETIKDQAFPFLDQHDNTTACADLFNRTQSCKAPLGRKMDNVIWSLNSAGILCFFCVAILFMGLYTDAMMWVQEQVNKKTAGGGVVKDPDGRCVLLQLEDASNEPPPYSDDHVDQKLLSAI